MISLRTRLVAICAVLATLGLLLADVATYRSLQSSLIDRVDATLAQASGSLEHAPPGDGGFGRRDPGLPGVYAEVRDAGGSHVLDTGPPPPGEARPTPIVPANLVPTALGVAYRTVGGYRLRAERVGQSETLIVALPLADTERTLDRLSRIELVVSLVVVGAIVLVGLGLVTVGLRPLRRIGATAAAIGAGDLSRRVEPSGGRTEIGQLSAALNAMLHQIEQSVAARRQFLSDASHELRTPVAAVRAFAELFDRGLRDHPEDLARAMAAIERESKRMSLLVDDLLILARLDEGRPLAQVPVDLVALAQEAAETSRVVGPAWPVIVEAGAPATVTGDPDRLRQVLDNLLGNVRTHTPAGTTATISVLPDGFTIADDGPGMDAQHVDRVAERFYRVDASRTRNAGGSGLGLAIASSIVAAHGGTLTITSSLTVGTTVCVTLGTP